MWNNKHAERGAWSLKIRLPWTNFKFSRDNGDWTAIIFINQWIFFGKNTDQELKSPAHGGLAGRSGSNCPFWAPGPDAMVRNVKTPPDQASSSRRHYHGGAKFLHVLLISTLLVLISHWIQWRATASLARWTRWPHPSHRRQVVSTTCVASAQEMVAVIFWEPWSCEAKLATILLDRNFQLRSLRSWVDGSLMEWRLLVLSTKTRTIWPWLPSHFLTRTITAAMLKLSSCIARCRESSQWSNAFEAIYRLSTGKRHSRCCSKACFPTISNDVFPFSPIPKENADVFCLSVSQDWLQTGGVSPQRGWGSCRQPRSSWPNTWRERPFSAESRYREMGYGPSDYPFVIFFYHPSITGFLVVLLLCMLSDGEWFNIIFWIVSIAMSVKSWTILTIEVVFLNNG